MMENEEVSKMMDEACTLAEERKHHYMRGHDDGKLFSLVKCKNKIGSIIQQHRREPVIDKRTLYEEMAGLELAFALIQEVEQEIRQTCHKGDRQEQLKKAHWYLRDEIRKQEPDFDAND